MVINLLRSYPSLHKEGQLKGQRKLDKNGNPITVFVYRVTGTDEELKQYEELCIKDGIKTYKDPLGYLWFTPSAVGIVGRLCISTNGKVFADTTAIDLANNMIKNFGEVGRMMAKDILAKGIVAEPTPELVKVESKIDDLD